MSENIEFMPLRDKIRQGERLVRDLLEHVELGFIPKAQKGRKSIHGNLNMPGVVVISDTEVRQIAGNILAAEEKTSVLCKELGKYLSAVSQESGTILKR